MNQFSARQNKAKMTLVKLQSCGITVHQIFNLYGQFEKDGTAIAANSPT